MKATLIDILIVAVTWRIEPYWFAATIPGDQDLPLQHQREIGL